jgi:dienelactone hydrolase
MIKKTISVFLLLLVHTFAFSQSENTGSYGVGFKYFKTNDESRNYRIESDTVFRPMLIHYWYPIPKDSKSQAMTFKDYIDLIAIREDFEKNQMEIDRISEGFIDAYLGFSKQQYGIDTAITTKGVLNSPVSAIFDAQAMADNFPLILYAPSNSKSAVQNHIVCEDLAANGYRVVAVGSAGRETLKRYDQKKATLAQVEDMEFLVKYLSDSLKINISDIGLLGFSTGSMATIIYQMRTPEVKAVASLDGSQEYAFYPILKRIEEFDFDKARTPYLLLANKDKDLSIFPYYSSISAGDKYLYRMTAIDHNGFISYWKQFALCSDNRMVNSTVESYTVLRDCLLSFFDATLKSGFKHPKSFDIEISELIQKDSTDYAIIAEFLNQILEEGIDRSIAGLKSNKVLYKGKANRINLVGRMFLGNENDFAIKIFQANSEIHPASWECFYNLALAFKENKDIDEAKRAIVKARDMSEGNEAILNLYDEIMKMD